MVYADSLPASRRGCRKSFPEPGDGRSMYRFGFMPGGAMQERSAGGCKWPAGGVWYLHITCIHQYLPVWGVFSQSAGFIDKFGLMSKYVSSIIS